MTRTVDRRKFLGLAAAATALAAGHPLGALGSVRSSSLQSPGSRQKFRIGHNLTTYISGGRGPDGFWKGVEEISASASGARRRTTGPHA